MKINGKTLDGPSVEVVVIPRQSGDIVFKAQAILDYDEHDKINPVPQPPKVVRPGGEESTDLNDKRYNERMDEWARQKYEWMFLKSLEATPGLEWEKVDPSQPTTWALYKEELREAGFSPAEVGRIQLAVTDACGLNQSKIEEATKRFLAGQGVTLNGGSSQGSELKATPSGEPASVSV